MEFFFKYKELGKHTFWCIHPILVFGVTIHPNECKNKNTMDVDTFYPFGFYVVFQWCFCNFPMVFLWILWIFGGLSLILWTCIGTSIETCINYTRKCFVYWKHINCCWLWPLLATLYFQNLVVHIQKTPCSHIWCVILWWDYCFNTLLGATNVKFHFLL